MTPDDYCQKKAAQSGSSFYYAFLFLPPERRRAITALYAFCREVDDAVDEPSDPQVATSAIAWWRIELGNLYAGKPNHPVTRALAPVLEKFDLRREHMEEIIEGNTIVQSLAAVQYDEHELKRQMKAQIDEAGSGWLEQEEVLAELDSNIHKIKNFLTRLDFKLSDKEKVQLKNLHDQSSRLLTSI